MAIDTRGVDQTRQIAVLAAQAAASKKAERTVVFSVAEVLAIVDAFVVTSGSNDRQVRTIAEEVEHRIKETGGPSPLRVEGLSDATWVLMDYGDVVVHVFRDDTRDFYDLERLWSDAPRWDWEAEAVAVPWASGE